MFGVDRDPELFVEPYSEVLTRPGHGSDINVSLISRGNPAMAPERQGRAFDAPAQQGLVEIAMDSANGVHIQVVGVQPADLLSRRTPERPQSKE